jgi:ADP-ribose pyrophosphatase
LKLSADSDNKNREIAVHNRLNKTLKLFVFMTFTYSGKENMKIKISQKLTDLKWLNMFNIEYIDKKGEDKIWQVASRKKKPKCVTGNYSIPDAVVIVPYHIVQKKIVITKEYRVPLAGYEYGFPAGLVDAGESVQQAARRELAEETGLELTRFLRVGPPVYSSAYVECAGEPTTARNEGTEDIEVMLASAREASRLCAQDSYKFDAKAWLVLLNFSESGRIWKESVS